LKPTFFSIPYLSNVTELPQKLRKIPAVGFTDLRNWQLSLSAHNMIVQKNLEILILCTNLRSTGTFLRIYNKSVPFKVDILTYTFYRYCAHSLVCTSIKNSTSDENKNLTVCKNSGVKLNFASGSFYAILRIRDQVHFSPRVLIRDEFSEIPDPENFLVRFFTLTSECLFCYFFFYENGLQLKLAPGTIRCKKKVPVGLNFYSG
jgi:hypothetical protein